MADTKNSVSEIQLPDGVSHPIDAPTTNGHTVSMDIPADSKLTDTNTTYSLSKNGSTITLTGSDGTSSEVEDSDTVPNFPDVLPNPNALTINVIGDADDIANRRVGHSITYDGSIKQSIRITIPEQQVPETLTITDENTLDSSGNATVTTYNGTSDASVTIPKTPDIPTTLPNPNPLVIYYGYANGDGSILNYDGSEKVEIAVYKSIFASPNDCYNYVYPVGSLYISTDTNGSDPMSLFGGTWEQIGDQITVGKAGASTTYDCAIWKRTELAKV